MPIKPVQECEGYKMQPRKALILAVDDDPLTGKLIDFLLENEGHEVEIAADPSQALRALEQRTPDLILLDVQLPRMDGFTLLKHIKKQYPEMPVIMLTARAEMQDKLTGLESGADDYVVKPFEPAELVARVKSVLRRANRQLAATMDMLIVENGIELNIPDLTAKLPSGEKVTLTPMEMRILQRLMSSPNRVVSRDDLAMYAAGYVADTSSNQIDVYIGRIRKKLGDDPNDPKYIATIRGSGYKFLSPDRLRNMRQN